MAAKATSLLATKFLFNDVEILEQLQEASIDVDNTVVDSRGLADRNESGVVTKQSQKIEMKAHWYDSSTSQEASALDITLYSIGGTDQKGQMKSGSIEIANSGPDTSAMVDPVEYKQPTSTQVTISADIMIVTEGVFTNQMLTAALTAGGLHIAVSITIPGETLTISEMVLRSTKHTVTRGEVQMENVTLSLAPGAVISSPSDSSILALATTGAAIVSTATGIDFDTGVNEYTLNASGTGSSAVISRMGLRFADKQLIEQTFTLDLQGGIAITGGSINGRRSCS